MSGLAKVCHYRPTSDNGKRGIGWGSGPRPSASYASQIRKLVRRSALLSAPVRRSGLVVSRKPWAMGRSLTAQALRICPRGTVEGSQYRRRGGAGQECES